LPPHFRHGSALQYFSKTAGERFSFILFTPDAYNVLLPSIAKEAQKLGFTAASSNGLDEPYFQSFRDLGKVLLSSRVAFFPLFSFFLLVFVFM
jgi:hypothetical protein